MPEATVGNPRTSSTTTTKTNTKGKPLGIPKWGWIVGIALGLVIGYMVLKKSKSSSGGTIADTSSGSDSSPLGNSDSGSGGGASSGSVPTNPFIISGNNTQGPGSDPGAVPPGGDSSTQTNPSTPLATQTQPIQYANVPEPSLPPYAPIPGTATHPGGNVPIQNIPYGSNVHQPGVQLG